ncbi:MAG: HEPN domain-containing protein [Candidatus Edwardsbacteria bacterium]|nr:HEPN domain-containing protein [Candidatus Edwardsbacteria bacterium]
MEKARESIRAAKELLANDHAGFSASRAYYAMFYAAEALLLTKQLSFSRHKAVISAFGKEFAKSGEMPVKLHRYFINAFDMRQSGDYGTVRAVGKKETKELLADAEEFIETIAAYLK